MNILEVLIECVKQRKNKGRIEGIKPHKKNKAVKTMAILYLNVIEGMVLIKIFVAFH